MRGQAAHVMGRMDEWQKGLRPRPLLLAGQAPGAGSGRGVGTDGGGLDLGRGWEPTRHSGPSCACQGTCCLLFSSPPLFLPAGQEAPED